MTALRHSWEPDGAGLQERCVHCWVKRKTVKRKRDDETVFYAALYLDSGGWTEKRPECFDAGKRQASLLDGEGATS